MIDVTCHRKMRFGSGFAWRCFEGGDTKCEQSIFHEFSSSCQEGDRSMDRALRMKPLLDFTRGPTFYPWPTVVPTRSFGIEFREFSHCASWVAFSCLEASVNDPFAKV